MDIKFVEREEFVISGFSVETTFENHNKDREIQFNDFLNEKIDLTKKSAEKPNEYYCVIWVTGKEKLISLLGQEIFHPAENFDKKAIRKAVYACIKLPDVESYDTLKAWEDFYQKIYERTSETGYTISEIDALAFEYYPNGIGKGFELWVLVEKV